MWNPTIPFVPGTATHITPSISGTQQMPGSTPMVCQSIPSTSATYSAPYNTQCGTMGTVPIYQHQGRPPMYGSNPQIQIIGVVPNMHMPEGNLTVPPPFSSMHGQSLIEMSVASINQSHMVSSVSVGNPQGIPTQSMGAPYSQAQMSQGGTAYTGGNFIPQYQNPHGNPLYNTVSQSNCYTM